MAQYNTITDVTRQEQQAFTYTHVPPCSGTQVFAYTTSPSAPSGVLLSYTPAETSMYRSDPTKGTKRNWAQIKRSGAISFTPLKVGKTTTENFVVSVPHRFSLWTRRWVGCNGSVAYAAGECKLTTTYNNNIHLGALSTSGIGTTFRNRQSVFEQQISEAISTTQQAAYASALSTFDLLTTLAEGRETLSFMQSVVGGAAEALRKFAHADETTYRRARGLRAKDLLRSSDKALRRLGSRWMEYRYAIMPLVYTIKDMNDLIGNRDAVYKTGRDRAVISDTLDSSDIIKTPETVLTYGWGTMEARVTSTYKVRYDGGALQRVLSQVGFNPFLTAWELIPYSFVIDWFLNVGDAIASATVSNFSTESAGVTAVKRKVVYNVNHADFTRDVSSRAASVTLNQSYPYVEDILERQIDALIHRVTTESYDRSLFTKPQPKVVFDPYLNWKRGLDGLVLTYQPIKKLLRSL